MLRTGTCLRFVKQAGKNIQFDWEGIENTPANIYLSNDRWKKNRIMNVLVLGASTNEERYSNRAVRMLVQYHHTVYAIGKREGKIGHVEIKKEPVFIENIHTVTLYLNPKNQEEYFDYILGLKPQRVIFNPGSENVELKKLLVLYKIEFEDACTLVMLRTGQF